jgi:cell division cycle 14
VQNGDLNWILPGKLLAFAGPTAVAKVLWGYRTFTPEDYWGYFREHGVSAVVRLNNKVLGPASCSPPPFLTAGAAPAQLTCPTASCCSPHRNFGCGCRGHLIFLIGGTLTSAAL